MKFILPVAFLAAAVSAQSSAPGPIAPPAPAPTGSESGAGSGVGAGQGNTCDALHIVEACLQSETAKFNDCAGADFDCQCRASEAMSTCFNNCPNDPRAGDYKGQVIIHCNNASVHGTRARTTATKTGTETTSAVIESATGNSGSSSGRGGDDEDEDDGENPRGGSATRSADQEEATETANVGAGQLARDTGSFLLAVAGLAVAAL